jgi:large subunit ribosomal protein L24
MSLTIRKGDLVEVISGSARFAPKNKKQGRVIRVYPDKERVLIENINMKYKHMRPSNMNPKGGRVEKEAPVHISNVMLVCPECSKTTRVKARKDDKGSKVRYCMHCDNTIETVDR